MEYITMNEKERVQLTVFSNLANKKITQMEAAIQLQMSARWIREKYKRYKAYRDQGLIHKGRGKQSKKQWNKQEQMTMIDLLKGDWHDFGPTFTAEKLKELMNITVSKETVRKVMTKYDLWKPKEKRSKYRSRRERKHLRGIMVQLDGSRHDWFEGRGQWCTILVFIDDATSEILWLEFAKSESYIAVMQATKNYVMKHGIPHSFYVDFGSVFSVNLNNSERNKKTQWERAVESLSIKVSHAHSPQAKGRVERANRTLQDRLLHEMRLAKISSIEAANQFLRETDFIANHNARYAKKAIQHGEAHRPADMYDLDDVFAFKQQRVLARDFTIECNKRIFQLEKQQRANIRPKDLILITTRLDGSIHLSIRKINLLFKEIFGKPCIMQEEKQIRYNLRKPSENSRRWASGLAPSPTTFRRVE